jgi:serine/threonine protein kinase
VAASINHPNIVPIYDAGDADGLLYIVMRYVEGADMKALLRREGPLHVTRACVLISQVGGALHAAHETGLIHRDIKPGNILIERIDDGIQVLEHVYLADFGLTKHAQSRSGLTHTGQFVGTVDYVAPEQIEGRPVDKRADVYSLGCVLFECLTGVVPYHRESDVAVLWAHVQEPCPPISTLRSDLPEGMDEVVERAMAKSPDDRYQTAAEFVADLGRLGRASASRIAVSGVASSASASALSQSAQPPGPDGGSGSFPGAQGSAVGSHPEDDDLVTSMPGRAKRSVQGVVAALVLVAVLVAIGLFALSRSGSPAASPGTSTTTGNTPPPPTGFQKNTVALRRVMDPSLLDSTHCQAPAPQAPIKNVPLTIGANAVESLACTATRKFPTIKYAIFLYPNTNILQAAFRSVQHDWELTRNWQKTQGGCHTSGAWSGGPMAWRHPRPTPTTLGPLGGYRACYSDQSQYLTVWIHMRNNGTRQDDHYDVLVAATSTSSLPTDLRAFWRFNIKFGRVPIGRSLDGPLPPL